MDHSERSITNVGGQIQGPAWADAFLAELRGSIRAIVEPTHSLCMELQCRLIGLENKFALTDRALTEEMNIMERELFAIIENEQAFAYQQSGLCGESSTPGLSLDEHTAIIMDVTTFPNMPMQRRAALLRRGFRTLLGLGYDYPGGKQHASRAAAFVLKDYAPDFMLHHRPEKAHQCVRAEAQKTDAQILLPYGVLLTQFLYNLMTQQVLGAARAARARREEPAQGTEEQDLGQSSSQGLEGQRPSWVVSMMTELTEQMRAVMQPTHEMVGNISSRLSALELKVVSMELS
ncbi:hypothetical protein CJ030_MR5G025010 [Morella rubra]|uniref:Uncharacterized protein n=1 Tax=Morella rubra TaxID=262757 RepID=A0A6A1VH99_9ROSI|nr:hypothetical protein CJ030_MR5G025010 [Morella rubra]